MCPQESQNSRPRRRGLEEEGSCARLVKEKNSCLQQVANITNIISIANIIIFAIITTIIVMEKNSCLQKVGVRKCQKIYNLQPCEHPQRHCRFILMKLLSFPCSTSTMSQQLSSSYLSLKNISLQLFWYSKAQNLSTLTFVSQWRCSEDILNTLYQSEGQWSWNLLKPLQHLLSMFAVRQCGLAMSRISSKIHGFCWFNFTPNKSAQNVRIVCKTS